MRSFIQNKTKHWRAMSLRQWHRKPAGFQTQWVTQRDYQSSWYAKQMSKKQPQWRPHTACVRAKKVALEHTAKMAVGDQLACLYFYSNKETGRPGTIDIQTIVMMQSETKQRLPTIFTHLSLSTSVSLSLFIYVCIYMIYLSGTVHISRQYCPKWTSSLQ